MQRALAACTACHNRAYKSSPTQESYRGVWMGLLVLGHEVCMDAQHLQSASMHNSGATCRPRGWNWRVQRARLCSSFSLKAAACRVGCRWSTRMAPMFPTALSTALLTLFTPPSPVQHISTRSLGFDRTSASCSACCVHLTW